MINKQVARVRIIAFAGAVTLAAIGAQAQDSCVANMLQDVGYSVPFKMISTQPGNGSVTYTAGAAQIRPVFLLNIFLASPATQLFDDRFEPPSCPYCFANQPFWVGAPDNLTVEIWDWLTAVTVYIFDPATQTSTSFQGQCGGPSNNLLYGSDNTAMYVISFGTPQPPTQ